jgi:hypothetical protein
MSERYYGEYYGPGEAYDETILNEQLFEKDLVDMPIEIMGFIESTYLERQAAL